jgi:hypothetical protein
VQVLLALKRSNLIKKIKEENVHVNMADAGAVQAVHAAQAVPLLLPLFPVPSMFTCIWLLHPAACCCGRQPARLAGRPGQQQRFDDDETIFP